MGANLPVGSTGGLGWFLVGFARPSIPPQHHDIFFSLLVGLMDFSSQFVYRDLSNSLPREKSTSLAPAVLGRPDQTPHDRLHWLSPVFQGSTHIKPILLGKILQNIYL